MGIIQKIFCVSFGLLAGLWLCGCNGRTDVGEANTERIFLYGNGGEPQGIDPHMVSGVTESKIITALFEGLCADHASSDTLIEPGVAERWECNEDASVWTFHLRKNAKWSDGRPLTSEDFRFSYERMLTPELGAGYAEMLYFIEGAEAFNRQESKDFSQVGVETPDAHTLVIRCKESVPYLPSVTRHYTWFPVPKHVILAVGRGDTELEKMTDRGSRWTTVEHFVGNGPFTLAEWKFNSYLLTRRNQHYWDTENVWLDGVKFLPTANPYSEYRSFLNGQLHTTVSLPNELIDHARTHASDALRLEPYVGTGFLRVNTRRKPLDNPHLREALSLAIDREAICRNLAIGMRPTTAFTPPLGEYQPPEILRHDPDAAREMLAKAGYPGGKGLAPINLLTNSRETSRTLAEAIQAMWKRELNLDIQVSNQEWTTYLNSQHNGDYDIVLSAWIGDYLDPTTFLNMWIKDGGNNNTGWSSEKFESLLDRAGTEGNAAKRLDLLREADSLFVRDHAVIPYAWWARKYLLHPSVEGWNPLALDNHPYKAIRLRAVESD